MPTFLAVWLGHADGEAPFGYLKALVAGFGVLIGQLAEVRVVCGVLGQPLLGVGIVSANLDVRVSLVKENFRSLVSLMKSFFHYLTRRVPYSGLFLGS